jgi:hypothetical protein
MPDGGGCGGRGICGVSTTPQKNVLNGAVSVQLVCSVLCGLVWHQGDCTGTNRSTTNHSKHHMLGPKAPDFCGPYSLNPLDNLHPTSSYLSLACFPLLALCLLRGWVSQGQDTSLRQKSAHALCRSRDRAHHGLKPLALLPRVITAALLLAPSQFVLCFTAPRPPLPTRPFSAETPVEPRAL